MSASGQDSATPIPSAEKGIAAAGAANAPPSAPDAAAGRPYPVLLIAAAVAAALAGFYLLQVRDIVAPLYTDPVGPKAFPTLIGIGMLVSAGIMVMEYLQARKSGEAEAGSEQLSFSWAIPGVVVWTFAYLAVFEWLGYVLATAFYIIPLMMVFNRGRPLVNIVVGLLFSMVSYLCLAVLLEAQLPTGTLVERFLY